MVALLNTGEKGPSGGLLTRTVVRKGAGMATIDTDNGNVVSTACDGGVNRLDESAAMEGLAVSKAFSGIKLATETRCVCTFPASSPLRS